jgi:putative transposase
VRYAWICAHRDSYPVRMMCELLKVSPSGLYAAQGRAPSSREHRNAQLTAQIRVVQQRHRGRYGRRRMHPELVEMNGHPIGQNRVGRLMREAGLQSRLRRRHRVQTTDSKHPHPIAPNVLERDVEALAPDRKWVADLTYLPTAQGWLYLALIMDLFSRKIVGWAMSASMPVELTLEALRVALGWRDPGLGLIHHCDRGSQYAAGAYRTVLQARDITLSMSRKGNCWDNAPMESVNGTLKVECVHGVHFSTHEEAQRTIVEYIGYYNTQRRHSALNYVSPSEFERRWRADKQRQTTEALG